MIHQCIQRGIGRADVNPAQCFIPPVALRLNLIVHRVRCLIAADDSMHFVQIAPSTKQEDDFHLLAWRQRKPGLYSAAGVKAGTRFAVECGPDKSCGFHRSAIAAQKAGSIARYAAARTDHMEKCNMLRKLWMIAIAGQQGSARFIDGRGHVKLGVAPMNAQNPLDVIGQCKRSRAARCCESARK